MHYLTPEFHNALKKAIEAFGGVCRFAEKVNLPHAGISKLYHDIKPKTDIRKRTYEALLPYVVPYLPENLRPLPVIPQQQPVVPVLNIRELVNGKLDLCSEAQLGDVFAFISRMLTAGAAPPQYDGLSQEEGGTAKVG